MMKTQHRIIISDSRHMDLVENDSIDLVITSPPYPMISMWDDLFSSLSPGAGEALKAEDGNKAFEAMHRELDIVWQECGRVMKPGAFACINTGDAVRTIGKRFQLYPNHARIISAFRSLGFDTLPVVLWRKQTNAPNKFMGSGMLPAGAYITLEHEYILVFRKGGKREFKSDADKAARRRSGFFREERNKWFSDIWDFKGARQILEDADARKRSAAFPFELAYRLINMYSLCEDTILDPFAGTGTAILAAIACMRKSIGIEIDPAFSSIILNQTDAFVPVAKKIVSKRIADHLAFVSAYEETKGALKYTNTPHGFPVMTRQETGIEFFRVADIQRTDQGIEAGYEKAGVSESVIREKVSIKPDTDELKPGILEF